MATDQPKSTAESLHNTLSTHRDLITLVATAILAFVQAIVMRQWSVILAYFFAILMVIGSLIFTFLRRGSRYQNFINRFGNRYVITIYIVMILLAIAFVSYTLTLASLSARRYNIDVDEINLITRFDDRITAFFKFISIASIVIIFLFGLTGWLKKKMSFVFFAVSMFLVLLLGFGYSRIPNYKDFVNSTLQDSAYLEGLEKWDEKNFGEAISLFTRIYVSNKDASDADNALGRVAGAQYRTKQYKDSIKTAAKLIYDYPDSDVREESITTLHWAIYMLGKQVELSTAIDYIKSIQEQYPVREISPIWLGISPEAYQRMIEYEKETEITTDDRKKLTILVDMFSQDRDRDYGLFLLQEYERIIDEMPGSKIIDWAYYARGTEAFIKGNYADAAEYYLDFANHFPYHRWKDDATYKAALSYLRLNNKVRFIELMSEALEYPDGDMIYWINNKIYQETIGLSSNELIDLTKANITSSASVPTCPSGYLFNTSS